MAISATTGVISVITTGGSFTNPGIQDNPFGNGPDGNVLVVEAGVGPLEIDEIDVNTHLESILIPRKNAVAAYAAESSVTDGPDGTLWFVGISGDNGPGLVGETFPLPADEALVTGTVAVANSYVGSAGGRVVFDDLKGDGTFDLGDPATLTDTSGTYALVVPAPSQGTIRVLLNSATESFSPGSDSQPVTVTAYEYTPGGNLGIAARESVLPLATVANPFGANQPDLQTAEVTALYQTLLGRAPDAPGLAANVSPLRAGTPLATIAAMLVRSTEYQTRLVTSYYATDLDHVATPAEVSAWLGVIQSANLTPDRVAIDFLASPAYAALHPGNHGLISGLYDNVFGRTASALDLAAWDAAFAAGTTPLEAIDLILDAPSASSSRPARSSPASPSAPAPSTRPPPPDPARRPSRPSWRSSPLRSSSPRRMPRSADDSG